MNYIDYCIDDENFNILKQMMRDVTTVFKKLKITYWADGGSLLNTVRGFETMRHDDDIDLGVFPKDRLKLQVALNILESMGYSVKIFPDIYKVFVPNYWKQIESSGQVIGTPTLDIFIYRKYQGRIELENEITRKEYTGGFHYKEDFYPLIPRKIFGEIDIPTPKKPKGYLDRLYPEWERVINVQIRGLPEENQPNVKRKNNYISFQIV